MLSGFKAKLKQDYYKTTNRLFLYGTSHGAINHSRIRMGLSGLNQQRRKFHFVENGRCGTCNFIREDPLHYFLKCQTYAPQRQVLFREICQTLAPGIDFNLLIPNTNEEYKEFISIIMCGSEQSDYQTNVKIFDSVHKFILGSKRFM